MSEAELLPVPATPDQDQVAARADASAAEERQMSKLKDLLNDLRSKSQFVDALTSTPGNESNTDVLDKRTARLDNESSLNLLDAFRGRVNELDPSSLDGFRSSLNDEVVDNELLDAFSGMMSSWDDELLDPHDGSHGRTDQDEKEFMEPESKMVYKAPVPRIVISKNMTSEYKPLVSKYKNNLVSEYQNDLASEYKNDLMSEYTNDLVSGYTNDLASEYNGKHDLVSQYGVPGTDVSDYNAFWSQSQAQGEVMDEKT